MHYIVLRCDTVQYTDTTTVSFRTEKSKRAALDKVAESLERDRSWVINEAIDGYLELQRWQIGEIEKGIADSDAGRTLSTGKVRDRLAKKHALTKARGMAK